MLYRPKYRCGYCNALLFLDSAEAVDVKEGKEGGVAQMAADPTNEHRLAREKWPYMAHHNCRGNGSVFGVAKLVCIIRVEKEKESESSV